MSAIALRAAGADDITGVAELFMVSVRGALPFLKVLHTPEEDRAHFRGFLDAGLITLAETEEELVGFVVETPGWINHLYIHPQWRGRGIGTLLVDDVKSRQPSIALWCFLANLTGRAFYQAQGFSEFHRTEGDNEQGLPDILFRWSAG